MLSKLSVATLYKMFGKRSFKINSFSVSRQFGTRKAQVEALIASGDLVKQSKFGSNVYFYLSAKALETFAPTVNWWAD